MAQPVPTERDDARTRHGTERREDRGCTTPGCGSSLPGPRHHRLGLVCLGVGLQHGALPTVGPRTLDHHVAVVISAGTRLVRTARRAAARPSPRPPCSGSPPACPHHYGPDPETGWDEGFVDFTGPATATYTELGYIEPDRPVVPLSDAAPARAAVGRIARAARRGNPLLEVETGAAVHELLVALRRARADTAPDGDQVLQALARDAFLPLSVADHAARHGMTPAELRTAVRRGAGCSPKDYLLGIRLGRAKELLAATELPVAAVARRVGYDDPAYFSRLFTRRVGMPPVRFRDQQGRTRPRRLEQPGPRPRRSAHDRTPARPVGLVLHDHQQHPHRTTSTPPSARNSPGCATASTTSTPPSSTCSPNASSAPSRSATSRPPTSCRPPTPPARPSQIARLRSLAENARLDPAFAEKLLNFIIAEVIRHHETHRGRRNGRPTAEPAVSRNRPPADPHHTPL